MGGCVRCADCGRVVGPVRVTDQCRAFPACCGRHVAQPSEPEGDVETRPLAPSFTAPVIAGRRGRVLVPFDPDDAWAKAPSRRQRNGQRHGGARRHRAAHPRLRDPFRRGLSSVPSVPATWSRSSSNPKSPNATTCPTICAPHSTTIAVLLGSGTRSLSSSRTPTGGSMQPSDTPTSDSPHHRGRRPPPRRAQATTQLTAAWSIRR